MTVDMISKETIKPSPRTIKLSLFDQLSPLLYVAAILFYPANSEEHILGTTQKCNRLKQSLSQILIHFYPFAGKIRDKFSIECNGDGVDYSEARVDLQLTEALEEPELVLLHQLLPCDMNFTRSATGVLLAVRVNIFSCGGLAVGVCLCHKIADAYTITTFVNHWAAMARDNSYEIAEPNFKAASIFPPKDIAVLPSLGLTEENCITRRFVFDGSKIAALKSKVASSRVENPSRVEAVSALIWKCVMAASRSKSGSPQPSVVAHAVNLREKIIPPLPNNSIGNIVWSFIARYGGGNETTDLHELVYQLRKSKSAVDEDYVKRLQCEDAFSMMSETFREVGELIGDGRDVYIFSSWCRFPLYEADFGWGKPLWVTAPKTHAKNIFMLMDTNLGNGIEAWLTLEEEEMLIFQQDQDLLEFASFNPSVVRLE